MYSLKGIFPEPKKEHKKNFIKENMKQLKCAPVKPGTMEPKLSITRSPLKVKSSTSKNGKVALVGKPMHQRKNYKEMPIKKGDMAEFLKRKELRQTKSPTDPVLTDDEENASEGSSTREIGCQTNESIFENDQKLTTIYTATQQHNDEETKLKASGDCSRRTPRSPKKTPRRNIEATMQELEKSSRLNSILERKDPKDPYLPAGYQKGVLPKYLRDRKEVVSKEPEEPNVVCPPGHVTLPDNERKETLRMLRNSFAELVSELNKMPVKTDTLRMRNRKMELEKQLTKLEEGIKVFSRPKVFVKIGE